MRSMRHRGISLATATALSVVIVAAPVSAQDSLEGLDFGSGTAVIEIGTERYEFDMSTREIGDEVFVGICRGIFGFIQASGRATDGRAITIEMGIPPVDWEAKPEYGFDPPNVKFSDADNGVELVANARLAELFGVESESGATVLESDGFSATGTATFVDALAMQMGESSDPVEGTFEIHCDQDE